MEIQNDPKKEISISQEELQVIQHELRKQNMILDKKVNLRTRELQKRNNELRIKNNELKISEDKFRAIVETSPEGIAITSLDGKVEYVSSQILLMWGYDSPNDMIGRNMTDFIRSDYHQKAAHSISEMFNGNFIGAEEYVCLRKDGSEFFLEANANILYNQNKEPKGILLVERDISQRKKYQQEILKQKEALKESNTKKDKFFSIIAHDLKSPFQAMLGFSEILNNDFDKFDTEQQKEFIKMINTNIHNTYNLLENLLLWSRPKRGCFNFKPEKINLHLLSSKTTELLTQSAVNKSIKITNQISKDIFIRADKDMFSIIIRNLISNAIKFTTKGGEIIIKSKISQAINNIDFIEIIIEDNGLGISETLQSKLFDLSECVSTVGTKKETGTGLGLILCKEFVEKHGGIIWVESEVNKGSKFIFTIPRAND